MFSDTYKTIMVHIVTSQPDFSVELTMKGSIARKACSLFYTIFSSMLNGIVSMNQKYIQCIERFCAGETLLSGIQLLSIAPLCIKSTKTIGIKARNYTDEFLPLLFLSHFETPEKVYKMKHASELETGYDAIDTSSKMHIQLKRLYDGLFWRQAVLFPHIDLIESSVKSIALSIVRKHIVTYSNINIVAHIPIPKDVCDDLGVERLIDSALDILKVFEKQSNKVTVTAHKPYKGMRMKIYRKKLHSFSLDIKLVGG